MNKLTPVPAHARTRGTLFTQCQDRGAGDFASPVLLPAMPLASPDPEQAEVDKLVGPVHQEVVQVVAIA